MAQQPKLILPMGHTGPVLFAEFSPDSKKIVTTSSDNTAKIWDAASGRLLADLQGHTKKIYSAQFSANGNRLVTVSEDATAIIWDLVADTIKATLKGGSILFSSALFSPDATKVLTVSQTGLTIVWNADNGSPIDTLKRFSPGDKFTQLGPASIKIVTSYLSNNTVNPWDIQTDTVIAALKGYSNKIASARLSPDRTMIVTASEDKSAIIWSVSDEKKKPIPLMGHTLRVVIAQFSPDGKKIVTASMDGTAKVWDTAGKLLVDLRGHTSYFKFAQFSPDGKKIVTASYDKTAKIWDADKGNLITTLRGHTGVVNSAVFSPGSTKIVTASSDKTAKIWDVEKGNPVATFKGHDDIVNSAQFSPDSKRIVTASADKKAMIWDVEKPTPVATLKEWDLKNVPLRMYDVLSAQFSPDGEKIVTASVGYDVRKWNAGDGTLIKKLYYGKYRLLSAEFSPVTDDDSLGGKYIVAGYEDSTAKVWDAKADTLITTLVGHRGYVVSAQFSMDGKKIVTASKDKTAKIWDAKSYTLDTTLIGHRGSVNSAQFSPDGKKIVTASFDNTAKVWDVASGNCLYTFMAIDSTDYLVIDKDGHYDGTDSARGLLYFAQGSEIVLLAQVKDPLWMPGLAERLNRGDTLEEKSLAELNIFGGAIPEIEVSNDTENEYKFSIKPGQDSLGESLGEIILFVNKIEARRYSKEQLINNNGQYELNIKKDSLKNYFAEGITKDSLNKYFLAGKENWIALIAKTKNNLVTSNKGEISFEIDKSLADIKPNLFAVMVGTSQYKEAPKDPDRVFDTNMDLVYPAIDARAVSQAVEMAARKMLNTDKVNHVFMYNLTTDSADALKPNKQNIKLVLDSIGKKATVNDVLLIFLSGHGVFAEVDEKKQFYYMTADASSLTDEKAYPEVGISTDSLIDWIRLENIAASKRILILDACNSGGAIYDAIKNFDKMNQISGLFILAASTSKELAIEDEGYKHGYLTYSLLKVISQLSNKLEDGKFLNIVGWFNAAQKIVPTLAKKILTEQTPQLFIHTADFPIGEITDSLINSIRLEKEKPLFVNSEFRNSVKRFDDLSLRKKVDNILEEIASKDSDPKFIYERSSIFSNAYSLYGDYTVTGNKVKIESLKIIRDDKEIKVFDDLLEGTIDKLPDLAKTIAELVAQWAADKN